MVQLYTLDESVTDEETSFFADDPEQDDKANIAPIAITAITIMFFIV